MNRHEEEIRQRIYEKMSRHAANASAGAPKQIKDVNPRTPERPATADNAVQLHRIVQGIYEIHLPRRGRLGNLAILGEDGNPINPGPREFGPRAEVAIEHFKRVSAAFDRMNGYE